MQIEITSGPDAGRRETIRGDRFTVGREGSCNLVLRDEKASRRHAYFSAGGAQLHDMGSSNGTFVNGQQVQQVALRGGEEIRIGDTTMRVVPDPPPPPPPPPPMAPPGPSPSTIQRLVIQRSLKRVTVIGIVAIALLVVVAVLLVTGVFNNDKGGTKARTAAEVVDAVRPSTVLVVNDKGGGTVGRGSGWVWDASRGLIVTNAHVVAGGESYTISRGDKITLDVTSGGSVRAGPEARDARLEGQALCEDMAVLRVDDKSGLETMPRFPRQKDLHVADQVVAVGYPATANLSAGEGFAEADLTGNTGVVSTVETTFQAIPGSLGEPSVGPYQNVILTDTVINQGNSGGPLVDLDSAKLIGMNSAQRRDVQGQNYAIGIDRIDKVVPGLIDGHDPC